jgi:hypothetical protein
MNGDGKMDLVTQCAVDFDSQALCVSLGNGDGTFGIPIFVEQWVHDFTYTSFTAVGDFNGDHKPDLAANTGDFFAPVNGVQIFLNTTPPATIVSVAPAAVTFASQVINTTSSAIGVVVKNTGTNSLTITQVALGGTYPDEFAETNNCIGTFAPGGSCTISVTFTPTVAKSLSATLSTTDNALSGLQTVALSGAGVVAPDFQSTATALSPNTLTAGGSATSTLTVTALSGFSGTVSLACAVTPVETRGSTCTLMPTSVSLSGSNSGTATMTVATTAPATTSTVSYPDWPAGSVPLAGALFLLGSGLLLFVNRQIRMATLGAAWVILAVGAWVGCGGGSLPPSMSTTTPGTPAGTYTVTVTATSGNLIHNSVLTVVVQ